MFMVTASAGTAAGSRANESTIVPVMRAATVSSRAPIQRAIAAPASEEGERARTTTAGSAAISATMSSPRYGRTTAARFRGRRSASSARIGVRAPVLKKSSKNAVSRTSLWSGAELLAEGGNELGDGHADLGHRVTLADGDRTIDERLEVHGHAERGSDLILPSITAADRLGLIKCGHELRPHGRPDLSREG